MFSEGLAGCGLHKMQTVRCCNTGDDDSCVRIRAQCRTRLESSGVLIGSWPAPHKRHCLSVGTG